MSDKTQAMLLVSLQFILFALLAGVLLFLPDDQTGWVRLIGIGMSGLALLVVAVGLLDHIRVNRAIVSVSPEPNASRQLVVIGLYRWIRHPLYLGGILVGWGAALAHGHWAGYILAVLMTLFFTYKSMFEERWLMRVYADYAAYRQRTGRFLPLLLR